MRLDKMILLFCLLFCLGSCNDQTEVLEEDERMKVEALILDLENSIEELATRAVTDYVVNSDLDISRDMDNRYDWEMEVQIYKSGAPYGPGYGLFEWNIGDANWQPAMGTTVYFPNYTRQQLSLSLAPSGYTGPDKDQSTANKFILQDKLIQNGDPTVTVNPAHIPHVSVKHANSLIDFRITNVDINQVTEVWVTVGSDRYEPLEVRSTSTSLEYMLILPAGNYDPDAPVVHVNTVGGARYTQTTENFITNLAANQCRCFTLRGLELQISEVTVIPWTVGPGISGEYTTETSYPTFKGTPDLILTLFFDNGLNQTIIFNDQGEATEKPLGRTLIAIRKDGGVREELPVPLVLRNMLIDLTGYL